MFVAMRRQSGIAICLNGCLSKGWGRISRSQIVAGACAREVVVRSDTTQPRQVIQPNDPGRTIVNLSCYMTIEA